MPIVESKVKLVCDGCGEKKTVTLKLGTLDSLSIETSISKVTKKAGWFFAGYKKSGERMFGFGIPYVEAIFCAPCKEAGKYKEKYPMRKES